jgi:DNA-binding response OmpR family regulator
MLAEDDEAMLSLLTSLLKMEGYTVIALETDTAIVGSVLKHHPDILLMDVHLAHVNGLDVLAKLRATPGGDKVRVVMVSGLDFKDQCMTLGANAFVQKPFMPEELFKALREA